MTGDTVLTRRQLLAGAVLSLSGLVAGVPAHAARAPSPVRTALVVVDVQVDFCEGGSLGVNGGRAVARGISRWLRRHADDYQAVIATRDWHIDPGEHFSAQPDYERTWPVHCRAGTPGARFHPALDSFVDFGSAVDSVVSKGQYSAAYSGFEGSTRDGHTLEELLRQRSIDRVHAVGIATDYCVEATVLDALSLGFGVRVLSPLCAGVDPARSRRALRSMESAGAAVTADLSKASLSLRR